MGIITYVFTGYIAVDTLWIVLSPTAVPRFAGAIVLHHVITLAILYHPLQHEVGRRTSCMQSTHSV